MATPFNSEDEIDYQQAKKLALALLDSGSDGLVISGTTGESPTLTIEEKLRLFSEIRSATTGHGSVIAGTGNYSTEESKWLTREAEKLGVDACLLIVPYYNRPTQQGLLEHFKAVAGATSLPCIIYNVPSRTVTNIDAATTIKLSRVGNIIGIKEASGNLNQIANIVEGTADDFLVYSGNDSDTLSILTLGGYGAISVASHLIGKQIKEMMRLFLQGASQEAIELHQHLLPLINALFIVSNPIPLKYALTHLGFPVGKPRLPLTDLEEESTWLVQEVLQKYTIDLPIVIQKE
jgi:4-hydroxy-tetrahydrodipicolinate synthase